MGGSRKRTREEETIPLLVARQEKPTRFRHDAENAVHPLTELLGLLQAATASQKQQQEENQLPSLSSSSIDARGQLSIDTNILKKPPLAPSSAGASSSSYLLGNDKLSPKTKRCVCSSSSSSSSSGSGSSSSAKARTNPGLAMYGTMRVSNDTTMLDISPEQVSPTNCSQSETESDSDGSCPPTVTRASLEAAQQQEEEDDRQRQRYNKTKRSGDGVLQSILRLKSTKCDSCGRQKTKKSMSVEFALDQEDLESGNHPLSVDKRRLHKSPSASADCSSSSSSWRYCATSRCMPRRLTLEEKLELYRVRPDLEINPAPLVVHELEERQRRRQRKLMFSLLGATLVALLVVVFYSLFSQF